MGRRTSTEAGERVALWEDRNHPAKNIILVKIFGLGLGSAHFVPFVLHRGPGLAGRCRCFTGMSPPVGYHWSFKSASCPFHFERCPDVSCSEIGNSHRSHRSCVISAAITLLLDTVTFSVMPNEPSTNTPYYPCLIRKLINGYLSRWSYLLTGYKPNSKCTVLSGFKEINYCSHHLQMTKLEVFQTKLIKF